MSIDQGSAISYSANYPIPGLDQGSQGFRNNFAIIKKAIERLQLAESTDDSIFAIETLQDEYGAIAYDVKFRNNAFKLPTGNPDGTAEAGMVRYQNGIMQVHNGTSWGVVSGPSLADIIAALTGDDSWQANHGDMPGGDLHAVATQTTAGFMSAPDKVKLDALRLGFGRAVFRSDHGIVVSEATELESDLKMRAVAPLFFEKSGEEVSLNFDMTAAAHGQLPGGDLHALAVANGAAGFISGSDKAKLDALITTVATNLKNGYMSKEDKAKLDGLAMSFSQIDVNNGPILPPANGALAIEGANGIYVSAVPGQHKLLISLGSIGGLPIDQLAGTLANFNLRNDRLNTPIDPVSFAPNNKAITHTTTQNGSVNIKVEWNWYGDENEIDGFAIYTYQSSGSTPYTFAMDARNEAYASVPASSRSFLLLGMPPERFYTFYVQAYRRVDPDIDPDGLITSTAVKSLASKENPYRPAEKAVFNGDIGGSVGGKTVGELLQSIAVAGSSASWADVTGSGRPQDFADVTANSTAKNTLNVGTKTAAEVVGTLGTLTSNIGELRNLIAQMEADPETAAAASKAYAEAAQLARDLANAARDAAQAANMAADDAYNRIFVIQGQVEQDRTTAVAARSAAMLAQDAAVAAALEAADRSEKAGNSATAASGSAELSQSYADESGSNATAAQASNLMAFTTVSETRPFDFTQDALFWSGMTTAAQGASFQDVYDVGRTYRQRWNNGAAWLAPIKSVTTMVGRRYRATVRVRYLNDAVDKASQMIRFRAFGQKMDGTFEEAGTTMLSAIENVPSGGLFYTADGWRDYAIEFTPDSAFQNFFPRFNIRFCWNDSTTLGNAQIEILTYRLEDVTESNKAEVNAAAAVREASAAFASQTAAEQHAQASKESAVTASTAAGDARSYRLEAAESANTATGAKNTAVQQAGVATNAAQDSQNYSNSAAAQAFKSTSEANRAETSATSAIESAATAESKALESENHSIAASGHAQTASTKASEAGTSAEAAEESRVQAASRANDALTSSQAASGFAQTASTFATDAETAAASAIAIGTQVQSAFEGATQAAQAATERSQASATKATEAEQSASAAERANVTAKLVAASMLPFDFSADGRFWGVNVVGTPETRSNNPPLGTYVTVSGVGKVFQTLQSFGRIAPVGVFNVEPNRIYRIEAVLRATTTSLIDSTTQLYVSGLTVDYLKETSSVNIDGRTPMVVEDGWVTLTGTVTSEQLSGGVYARPVVSYNGTRGNHTIQIRTIRVIDVTEQKNAEASVIASAQNATNAAASKNEAGEFANVAQEASTLAATSAGQAETSRIEAAASSATAEGFSNQSAISQRAAAESANAAGRSATAASGFVQSAETFASDAKIASAASIASEVVASTTAAALFPSGFTQDGKFWTLYKGTATYQDVLQTGRTMRVSGYTGPNWVAPFSTLPLQTGRRYRATVRARYFSNGTYPAMQGVTLKPITTYPDNTNALTLYDNKFGVQTAVLNATNSWKTFSVDFALTGTAATAQIRFNFNEGVANTGNGVIEILYFKVEDVTDSAASQGSAEAAAVSSSTAKVYSDSAGQYAESANRSATSAATSSQQSQDASNAAKTFASEADTYREEASRSASNAYSSQSIAILESGAAAAAATSAGEAAQASIANKDLAFSYADEARQYSEASSQSATAASVSEGNAQTYASTTQQQMSRAEQAADAAAASAAEASSSTTVEAGVGLNSLVRNSVFTQFTKQEPEEPVDPEAPAAPDVYLPTGWDYVGTSPISRTEGEIGVGNSLTMVGDAGEINNVSQMVSAGKTGSIIPNAWYVLEADVRLVAGTLRGAGVVFRSITVENDPITDYPMTFSIDVDNGEEPRGDGVVDTTYRFRKLVQITDPSVSKGKLFAITHDPALGDVATANEITWFKCSIRPAANQEITSGNVGTDIEELRAIVNTQAGALASMAGKSAAYWTTDVNSGSGANAFISARAETTTPASTPLTLLREANLAFNNRTVTKTGGAEATWDASTYSLETYTGVAYASFSASNLAGKVVVGLSTTPTPEIDYSKINYGIFCDAGTVRVVESGVTIGSYGSYTAVDVFSIHYNGTTVVYAKNGVAIRNTIGQPAGLTLSLDMSLGTMGAIAANLVFGSVAPTTTSNVSFGASEVHILNSIGGEWKKALSIVGGEVKVDGRITAGQLMVTGGDTADNRLPSGLYVGTTGKTLNNIGTTADAAYSGTIKYRTAGAPTNAPQPTGITVTPNSNGSLNIRLEWAAYTQGAIEADWLVVFWRKDGLAPTVNDASYSFTVNKTLSSYHIFEGVNPADTYSFGLAAARKSETGLEVGIIVSPTTTPLWRGIGNLTPNYTANINGVIAADISTATVNFNTRNDRNGDPIISPTFTPEEDVDHTLNTDGSCNISVEWGWEGDNEDIDGFVVTVRRGKSDTGRSVSYVGNGLFF